MDALPLFDKLIEHQNLSHLSMTTIVDLITRASALKRDIMQPQSLSTPIDCPPDILPQSVALFLAESFDLSAASVQGFWDVFKVVVWHYPSTEDRKHAEAEAFRDHGHKRGFSEPSYTIVFISVNTDM